MRLVAYQGLILDFGGVITTDFHGCLAAFCVRQGLAPDAVTRFVDDTPANLVTARQLGMAAVHFTGAPSDFAEIERLIGIA